MPRTEELAEKAEILRTALHYFQQELWADLGPLHGPTVMSAGWGKLSHLVLALYTGYSRGHETALAPFDSLLEENARLRAENVFLMRRLEELERRLSRVEEILPEQKVVVIRSVSEEEARAEIRQMFSTGRTLYYSDIAEDLGLDLRTVVRICEELRSEGEIEVDADALQHR